MFAGPYNTVNNKVVIFIFSIFNTLNFPAITEVKSAVVSDSGNYTCSPANTLPAHVLVFVNKGDNILQIEGRLQTNTSNYEHFSPDI
jgi:hypothetical protein